MLASLRAAVPDEGGCLVVVHGPAGVGKTALFEALARNLDADGVRVLPVWFDADTDEHGVSAVVRAVRERFEQFADPRIGESLAALTRLLSQDGAQAQARMLDELGQLFARIARHTRTALVVDDAHLIAEPTPVLTGARRAGCLVLAACRKEVENSSPGILELVTAADEEFTLGPLADEHVAALVRDAAGGQVDDAVLAGLRSALGPLCTNPGTVLSTLADLRDRGLLVMVRDRLVLREAPGRIALPDGHDLLLRTRALGDLGLRLLSSVALLDELEVDDLPLLAEAIDADLAECGSVFDRLIEGGVLVADPSGRVRCRCPALAAAARGGELARKWLHTAIAKRLLERHRAGSWVAPAVLADHVARSGLAVQIDDDMVTWLLDLAEAAARDQPERGAHWCAAALRRLPTTAPEHARALALLLGLVVGTGQYELLREVLTRYAQDGCEPVSFEEIRMAAVFDALYTGEPAAEPEVRALLDAAIADGDPMAFGEWWFGRRMATAESSSAESAPIRRVGLREPMAMPQIELLRAALSGDPDACGRAWREVGRPASSPELDRLRFAAGVVDMAEVARIVLGPAFRVPERGVLGTYHRVVAEHGDANWSAAMSAVRELELSGCGDTLAHHAARLFAAEICVARGNARQAGEWLDDSTSVPRLAALRAWVEVGLLASTGQARRAVSLARAVCADLRNRPERPGLDRLLIRAVWLAEFTEDRDGAVALLEDIEELHRVGAWTDTMEIVFMARGIVHRDVVYTQVAADLARRRGNRPALLEACLAVARLAEDPRPWLAEAHEIATQCGASVLLDRIRAITRERGVSAPRARNQRETLSTTEQRIIELIKEGMTNRQIAVSLRVSEKTVENHLTRLFARTGCRSRVELVAASLEGRLVPVAS